MTRNTNTLAGTALAAAALLITGCAASPATPTTPQTTLVVVDVSGSIDGTDLLAAAENKTRELVGQLQPGGQVSVRTFSDDVTANCRPLRFQVPAAANTATRARALEAAKAAVAPKFAELVACARQYGHKTEYFGGVATAVTSTPDAKQVFLFSDACENVTLHSICDAKALRNPQAIADQVPDALIPDLTGVHITLSGVGRNAHLDAVSLENLRQAIRLWIARTHATCEFTD